MDTSFSPAAFLIHRQDVCDEERRSEDVGDGETVVDSEESRHGFIQVVSNGRFVHDAEGFIGHCDDEIRSCRRNSPDA